MIKLIYSFVLVIAASLGLAWLFRVSILNFALSTALSVPTDAQDISLSPSGLKIGQLLIMNPTPQPGRPKQAVKADNLTVKMNWHALFSNSEALIDELEIAKAKLIIYPTKPGAKENNWNEIFRGLYGSGGSGKGVGIAAASVNELLIERYGDRVGTKPTEAAVKKPVKVLENPNERKSPLGDVVGDLLYASLREASRQPGISGTLEGIEQQRPRRPSPQNKDSVNFGIQREWTPPPAKKSQTIQFPDLFRSPDSQRDKQQKEGAQRKANSELNAPNDRPPRKSVTLPFPQPRGEDEPEKEEKCTHCPLPTGLYRWYR